MVVSWFSAGVSSAVATKIALKQHPDMKIFYQHIDDQESDTLRFVKDCEKWFGVEIEIQRSQYKSVDEACRAAAFIRDPQRGAACTRLLKRRVRMDWEQKHPGEHLYIWGLDATETGRAYGDKTHTGIVEVMPEHSHRFPLIEGGLDKATVHGMLSQAGIRRPEMYWKGFPNNNCVGCVKGGMGYWQEIKNQFPDTFRSRCKMERDIGFSCLKECYLDELEPGRGRKLEIIVEDCGLFCEIPEAKERVAKHQPTT